MNEENRQRAMAIAVTDKHGAFYANLVKMLNECTAADELAKENRPYVVVPFGVEEVDVVALEKQFSVALKIKGVALRMCLPPRVAAMVFLVDSVLVEHAAGANRSVLMIDGDVMTVSALGLEGRVVERTNATPRLATGYFLEEDLLRKYSSARNGRVNVVADVMLRELDDGGGEHYWPTVRDGGHRVDSITVNHFKTPCGPTQLAWVASRRGATVFGAIPFQYDMLEKDQGALECFPGMFYIDRELDVMTLVPRSDATMSISHCYSSWCEIVLNNSVTVDGVEFLCEKYKNLTGILLYTLSPVNAEFEAPEILRTNYFDSRSAELTKLTYPVVKMSDEGVPVGFSRGSSYILTSRHEKVMSRLMISTSSIVYPAEAYVALMDYNNTTYKSLDSVTVAERMSYEDEEKLAVAYALHVNWERHNAKGTFNTLMNAMRLRYRVSGASLFKMAFVAVTVWWNKPCINDNVPIGELPVSDIVDWCGNDFSIVIKEADPWVEIEQEVGKSEVRPSKMVPWLPQPPKRAEENWYDAVLLRARACLAEIAADSVKPYMPKKFPGKAIKAASVCGGVVVDDTIAYVSRGNNDLTYVKEKLKSKLRSDFAAVNERLPLQEMQRNVLIDNSGLPKMPVPDVNIVASIRSDLDMAVGGLPIHDSAAVGFRLSEVDIDKHTEGIFSINDAKRLVPKDKWVRLPIVDAGVEGKRVVSQAVLLGAAFKRNIGIPCNRGAVDLNNVPELAVDKIIQVCFRDDWRDILEKHLNSGLWEPNVPDIDSFVADLDEKKVKTMMNEFFVESNVDMENWLLMAKGKIKPSRANDIGKIDHSQTIMYSDSKESNALYSSMLRRFKEVVDEMLRPEVSLNPQRSDEEHERWYNSLEAGRKNHQRTYSYSTDIKVYDRSQEHVAMRLDIAFYKRMGLNEERLKIWSITHGPKRATSMMFGLVLNMVLGGISGIFNTLFRNGIVNLAALLVSGEINRNDVVMIDIKGDDMDAEFSRPIKVESTVESMSLTFNLSARFNTNDVRYMCKSFRLKFLGKWYFVADPWARVQSLATPISLGNFEVDLNERWVSLRADLRHYDNGFLVDLVAEAAMVYYGLERPLYGMARALSAISADKSAFYGFFGPPVKVN